MPQQLQKIQKEGKKQLEIYAEDDKVKMYGDFKKYVVVFVGNKAYVEEL